MNISVVMLQQSSLTIIVDVSIIVFVASVITAVVDASTTIFVFITVFVSVLLPLPPSPLSPR